MAISDPPICFFMLYTVCTVLLGKPFFDNYFYEWTTMVLSVNPKC